MRNSKHIKNQFQRQMSLSAEFQDMHKRFELSEASLNKTHLVSEDEHVKIVIEASLRKCHEVSANPNSSPDELVKSFITCLNKILHKGRLLREEAAQQMAFGGKQK